MQSDNRSDQEKFWAGEFGDAYIDRNQGKALVAGNISLFATILNHIRPVKSCLEFGANIGLNLMALRQLLPEADLSAVEINPRAVAALQSRGDIQVYSMSVREFCPETTHQRDFVFTKGLLIHIHPDHLPEVYDVLYRSSRKYICVIEYYNPTPVSLEYRGHKERLFKRDFAGDLMDAYADLQLIRYGFVYHRDPLFAQDDLTWFLMEKGAAQSAGVHSSR